MHKSRLAGFIIDCKTDGLTSAATFWGGALGMQVRTLPAEEGNKYVQLVDPQDRLHVEVQSVSHPSRVHLDIETDDVDAEAERLEKLGAKRIKKINTWWVMEAPTGQRFCVVRAKALRLRRKLERGSETLFVSRRGRLRLSCLAVSDGERAAIRSLLPLSLVSTRVRGVVRAERDDRSRPRHRARGATGPRADSVGERIRSARSALREVPGRRLEPLCRRGPSHQIRPSRHAG